MLAGDNGPQTKANSTSITFATDDPGLTALTAGATAANQASANALLTTIDTDLKRLSPLGPGPGSATPSASKIFGVAFTAAQTLNIDLTGANYTGLKTAIDAGKQLILKATAGCYYNWATSNITIAAASTAASNPGTQGVPMFDAGESPDRAPAGTTVLNILGGSAAGTLYVYIAE